MMDKYDEFFTAEKKRMEARMKYFMMGKKVNEIVKLVILFYDQKDSNLHSIVSEFSPEDQATYA